MTDLQPIIYTILQKDPSTMDIDDLKQEKRVFSSINKLSNMPSNINILRTYHDMVKSGLIEKNHDFEKLLKKRAIRSESGIVAVQVLTKPFPCPGKCIFCPNDPEMPKSYIKTEPGAMRALLNHFDPKKQVYNRLLSLTLTGHDTDKIEMIVLWGTWDVYPADYKIEFIKWLYDACNIFSQYYDKVSISQENKYAHTVDHIEDLVYSQSLEEAIELNQTAKNRIIGLTLETRPEFVTDENCQLWRTMWVTRLEMWVQSMYNDVLVANRRWHDVQCIRDALHKLRQYAFKFSIHIMPGLYKSSYEKDLWTFQKIYSDPFVKPDEIKYYPTSVIPNTKLAELYEQGKYKPLETAEIQKLITQTFLEIIPPYTRIKRLIRDIPATEISAWSNVTNLSQLTHDKMKKDLKENPELAKKLYSRLYWNYTIIDDVQAIVQKTSANPVWVDEVRTYIIGQEPDVSSYRNFVSLDTRSREVRNKKDRLWNMKECNVNSIFRVYKSSVGLEFFLSIEDNLWYLYWFTRLLLPEKNEVIHRWALQDNVAMIRELHVYWQMASLSKILLEKDKQQHQWFGSLLMDTAEKLSKIYNYTDLCVISGIGVRWYYEKLGYQLKDTYMVKKLW